MVVAVAAEEEEEDTVEAGEEGDSTIAAVEVDTVTIEGIVVVGGGVPEVAVEEGVVAVEDQTNPTLLLPVVIGHAQTRGEYKITLHVCMFVSNYRGKASE